HRPILETPIVDEQAKRFQPEATLADVRMAIDAAPLRLDTIVEMKRAQPVQPDQPVKFADGCQVCWFRSQAITCREDMTGVEAYPQPLRLGHELQDAGQVLKAMAQARTLSCRSLQQDLHAEIGAAPVNFIEGLAETREPCFVAA